MSRFNIAFKPVTEDAEVVGAVFDIEKDIGEEQEVNGADIGDITEDESQARIEGVLSIENFENEISSEIVENGRVEEVADNLTDLASVVSQIEEPSATDIALIQSNANMAVAGTDVDAQDILPAVESYGDMKIVAEGIGEKASAAMASLRESGVAMAAKISDYLKQVFSSLKWYEQKLIGAKAQIAELKSSGKKDFSVTLRGNRFFSGGEDGVVKDGKDFLKRVNESVAFHDKFSSAFIEAEKAFAGSVMKYWSTIGDSGAGTDAEKNKLYDAYFDGLLAKIAKLPGMERAQETKAGFDTYVNKNLLGNTQVTVRLPTSYKSYKDATNEEIRGWAYGSYIGTASTLGIKDRVTTAVKGVPVSIAMSVSDLEGLVRAGEKEVLVLKKYLDKVYQSANMWSKLGGPVGGELGSAHSRLVGRGRDGLYYVSFWARGYGQNILDAILKVVHAAGKSGVTTEDHGLAMEGIGGGILGVLKQAIPGFGIISASRDRKKAQEVTQEIQRVAKELAKLKGEALDEAKKDGKITDADYETYSDANAEDVVGWSIKDNLPFLSSVRGYKAGSQLQDLNRELKAKIAELKSLSKSAQQE